MPPDLYSRDAAALSRLQHLRFFPLAVAEGRGNELVEPDGRTLLDLSATWGAASLGYGHPAIRNAVAKALEAPAGAGILSAVSAPAVELAEALLEITPGTGERRVWLGHSGSDANETVARAVLEATGRPRTLAFHGAYHGGTSGSMAVSGHSSQEGAERAPGLSQSLPPVRKRSHRRRTTGPHRGRACGTVSRRGSSGILLRARAGRWWSDRSA